MIEYSPADSVPVVAHKTGVAQGRALERAKIVAYLRDCSDYYSQNWANDIEEGKHL